MRYVMAQKSDEVRSLLTRIRVRGINDNRDNAVHGCLYCRFIQDSLKCLVVTPASAYCLLVIVSTLRELSFNLL